MVDSQPLRSTRGNFDSIDIGQSTTVHKDIYYGGSINIEPGAGITFDGKIMSAIGGGTTIAGVVSINSLTGTVLINAGPGVSVESHGGTIAITNTGTVSAGAGIIIVDGTVASTISSGVSSLIAGQGIRIVGQATIVNTGTHAGYVTSFNAISPASNVPIYRAFSSSIIIIGTDGQRNLSLDPGKALGTLTTPDVAVSGTSAGTVNNGGLITYGDVTLAMPPGASHYGAINHVVDFLGGAYASITNAYNDYTVQGGTLILHQSNMEKFINLAGTISIREYGDNVYHVFPPLTVDKFNSLPIGSGLSIASGSLYATGNPAVGPYPQSTPTVSGSIYSNSNGYDMIVVQPVTFYPSYSHNATVTYAVGSTSPTSMPPEIEPYYSVTPGPQRNIQLYVPDGWNYSFTAVNATLGTPTWLGIR